MAYNQEQIDDILSRAAENSGGAFSYEKGKGLKRLKDIKQPRSLTSRDLEDTPRFQSASLPMSNRVGGELARFETQTEDNFTRRLQEQKDSSQMNEEGSFLELLKATYDAPTESGLQSKEYGRKDGVDSIQKELDSIDDQLKAEQHALRRQIEKTQTEAGLTKGQVNQAVSETERVSLRKQADLSVIREGIQGKFDSAKAIADRAIDAEMEFTQREIDLLSMSYERNKELFDRDEQRLFQTKLADRERALAEQKSETQLISDLSIQALTDGAPTSIVTAMRNAKTVEEAISMGGSYIGSLDRQKQALEIQKLNKEIANTGLNITNIEAGKYSGALSVILGSEKFTKEQKAAITNAINNGQDPAAVIKNQAKNIMGQTAATKLDNYETAKAQLESIDSLLSDYYTKGGTTNIFTGNYEKTLNKLGEVNNPELVDIATNIAAALQIYRNAVSGTAYSVQEGRDIASIFPGINKTQGLNEAILSGRMKAFETTIDSTYRNTLGTSYDDVKESKEKSVTDAKTKIINAGKINPQIQDRISQILADDPDMSWEDLALLLNI